MRQWIKVFILCIFTLMTFAVGNAVWHTDDTTDCPVSENEAECVYAPHTSNDIERGIDYILSSCYVDLLQHTVVSHSGSVKFLPRSFSVSPLHKTDCHLHKLHKLTYSTHPYLYGGIDYYIYTLERILI